MLNKNYNATLVSQIKSVKDTEGGDLIIEGYANTISKDRAGDVIPKEAWETSNALTNYLKNPIILAFHNHSKPIGKMVGHEITEFGLKIKALISKGAGDVYHLIKDGILSTFSVGFSIKDAEYDRVTDTYFITDVELHEVSVVSVPCNQDSVFSVAKSMESTDFDSFKNYLNPTVKGNKDKENEMTFDHEKFKQEMLEGTVSAASKAAADAVAAIEAEKEAKAKKEADRLAAEKATKEALKADATAAAEDLVKTLRAELAEKDNSFADIVKAQKDEIIALKDEIAQVVASRNNPMSAAAYGVKTAFSNEKEFHKEVDNLVMLSVIKKQDMFETKYGKKHYEFATKAVNTSSSIEVSSDGYETVFATNLQRDIQAALVVAPLFSDVTMTSANLTMPINPDRGYAGWVDAANYGTDASTDPELSIALTERTLKTFKLAAKTYLTEETEEDAILSLVPILRQHLVEAHANTMDRDFLRGSGTGQPKGLINQANAAGATHTSAAKSDGTVKVTALDIMEGRKSLGLYGINLNDIVLIVSQNAYWDLILDPEWGDVQQVGMETATKLKGEVGNIYGMRVIVSNHFEAPGLSKAYAVMVNTTNFVTARQRGMTLRSDFDVEKDRRVFVATQRANLEPLIEASAGNGKGVVEITYAAA